MIFGAQVSCDPKTDFWTDGMYIDVYIQLTTQNLKYRTNTHQSGKGARTYLEAPLRNIDKPQCDGNLSFKIGMVWDGVLCESFSH